MFEDFAEIIGDDRDREAWEKARAQGIGASEAAAVLGLNPWCSPLELFAIKRGLITVEATLRMKLGRSSEPVIAEEYAQKSHRKIDRCGLLLRSKEWPWLLATPDYTQSTDDFPTALVEIKDSSRVADFAQGPPDDVMCQIQQQMAVSGAKMVTVAVALDRTELKHWDVTRDDEWIEGVLVPRTRDFWQAVQDNETPQLSPEQSESDRRALKGIYRDIVDVTVQATEAEAAIDTERQRLKLTKQELDRNSKTVGKTLERLDNELLAKLGQGRVLRLPDGTEYERSTVQNRGYTVEPYSYNRLNRRKAK